MGCDIHLVLERRTKINGVDKWIGVNDFPYVSDMITPDESERNYAQWNARLRNYDVFAMLANVRGHSHDDHDPKGVPDDASDLALMWVEGWGNDGHSHSHLSAHEFVARWCAAVHGQAEIVASRLESGAMPEQYAKAAASLFGLYYEESGHPDSIHDHRVVFWFDN